MLPPLNAFFHPASDGHARLYLHHTPPEGTPLRSAVLYVPPWAEEMNKSRRMAALASRRLAEGGWAVLQIDLLGCGDSEGDFADANWDAWVDDVVRATQWLQARHPGLPLWLWGLRAGALLATAALPRLPDTTQLLLWQPVLQGKAQLQQFLRLKAAAQLADGGGKAILAAARAELAAGRSVEVAGYGLAAALAAGLEAATLAPPPAASPGPATPRRLIWLEAGSHATDTPGPAAQAALAAWQSAGWDAVWEATQGPAFWQTTEIEDAPAWIDATAAAMATCQPAAIARPVAVSAAPPGHDLVERPLLFGCAGERLLGILHPAGGDTGCVVVVGGPQYRVGSHRQFVHLARALAAAGHSVLRFDVRGMGDSSGTARSFESLSDDIAAAIDALQQAYPQVRRVVLWGLCDGASAALLYLDERRDARIAGVALANPWVRSPQIQARTRAKHYYARRMFERAFWRKLVTGAVSPRAASEFLSVLWRGRRGGTLAAAADFQARMLHGWTQCELPSLVLLSEHDYTAREFVETTLADHAWQRALQRSCVARTDVAGADHTFSTGDSGARVAALTVGWAKDVARAPRTGAVREHAVA